MEPFSHPFEEKIDNPDFLRGEILNDINHFYNICDDDPLNSEQRSSSWEKSHSEKIESLDLSSGLARGG